MPEVVLKNHGFCPICSEETIFQSQESWLRDHYICLRCRSLPRERALKQAIDSFYPQWRDLVIHESSPSQRGTSLVLQQEAPGYIPSHYFPDVQPGSVVNGYRCENLEELTFPDESIDLHISQDVLEHIFHPERAFAEIARTLKPGGAHIFTVPIVRKHLPTQCRAQMEKEGTITHILPPQYHGNPIASEGSLVTFDWGYDIVTDIWSASKLCTFIVQIDDLSHGIRAEYNDVFVTKK